MDYERLLRDRLGDRGRFHVVGVGLAALLPVVGGLCAISFSFAALEPPSVRCLLPAACRDVEDIFPVAGDQCRIRPLLPASYDDGSVFSCAYNSTADPVSCPFLAPADSFEYDQTVVTEFGLYCGERYKVALAGSAYMLGLLVGSLVLGRASDRWGRRPACAASLLISAAASTAGAFVGDYWTYAATRLVAGAGNIGCFIAGFVLAVELVGEGSKTAVGILFHSPFAVGEAAAAAAAAAFSDWRTYQLAVSAPMLLAVGTLLFYPESPRWLLARGERERYLDTVRRAAKMNKVELAEEELEIETGEEKSTESGDGGGIAVLFSDLKVASVTAAMIVNWMVVTVVYYGITFGATVVSDASDDGGMDVYLSVVAVSLVEIPAQVASLLSVDRLGRRTLFVASLVVSGAGCVAAACLADSSSAWVVTALSTLGKFGAAGAFCVVYLYTAELYPTEVRGAAVGLCSMCARIGGILAPQVALYLPALTGSDTLPLVLMGLTSLLGAGVTLAALPETLGAPLMETRADFPLIFRHEQKGFFEWWSGNRLQRHRREQEEKKKKKKKKQVDLDLDLDLSPGSEDT